MLVKSLICRLELIAGKRLNQGNASARGFILVAAEMVGGALGQAEAAFYATISEVEDVIVVIQAGWNPVAK